MSGSAARPARIVLSHELSAFLVEFSIALHKYAIYPLGHPSLGPAAARVAERAAALLETRPMLAFGVARQQLIIDGVATDPAQPVLRRLAEVLHAHHLGAMSVLPGIEASEIGEALHALAEEVTPGRAPLGLATSRLPEWPHLRLHPLTLERLELVDEEPLAADDASDGHLGHQAAQLWIGLANAAMALDSTPLADAPPPDPVTVARAIDDHAGAEAYDQVIVGYLLQIADELQSASGTDQRALRRRTARLIGAMRPETLQRLVTMGGNAAQRRAFVAGATSGMAVDSVVKILKAAADASGQTISHGLVRMLSKLAAHAEGGSEQARAEADGALREQVDRLLSGWELESPSPDGYARTLQHLATGTDAPTGADGAGGGEPEADPFRVVQISLEVGGAGPLVERAIHRAIDAGHVPSLLALLTSLPPDSGAAASLLRSMLSGPRAMSAVLSRDPVDFETLDVLLPDISIDAYAVLLDALIACGTRATRRKLLDRLAPTPFDASPLIVARLHDERWYVQRNLLLLLERMGRVPADFSAAPWTAHPDSRVRYHGVALQLTMPSERATAVQTALTDRDPRIVRLGLVACQDGCPSALVAYVANFATNPAVADDMRIHAVRALAASRDRQARDALLRLVNGGKTVLGRPKLAPRTTIVLGALRALAERWSSDVDAGRILALARQSSDPDLRRVVEVVRV